MIKALDFRLERLLKFETTGQAVRRIADLAFPLLEPRIGLLHPREIFPPFADIDKEMSQIPFVSFGDFNTRWNFFGAHFSAINKHKFYSHA